MKSNIIRIGILGAGGFTGQELVKILCRHGNIHLNYITSDIYKGNLFCEIFPNSEHPSIRDLKFSAHPVELKDIPEVDLIFLAVPDEVSIHWANFLLQRKIKVIDISGAFRLKNPGDYEKYYKFTHKNPELLKTAVYGMPEFNREFIKTASLVANPGCYATAAILPLLVLGAEIQIKYWLIDAKSGTSGAGGRKEKDALSFSMINENFKAYKIKAHQHIPEIIEHTASALKRPAGLNMTPHYLPLFRGLQTNTYLYLDDEPDLEKLTEKSESISKQETFIRFYRDPEMIELKNVQNTNFLDFGFYYDNHSRLLQIICAIDNLQKGAAGQAIQNMNLMFGLTEHQGLL
ncbi:MAG: N-acetyl-gamma-glutamyl-phosphate reductase [Spirochaetia bacterium]|nr:N-acetyl-gamma-glutamyl-phosphate reductase [Spirochaetia bacterium]